MRVLIAVTHLLGGGHLVRASAIARALARRGHEVTLVSGGTPTPLADTRGVELVQLPPVRCRAGDFSVLLDSEGRPASPAHLERRRRVLLSAFARTRPDSVVTEQFPFGRRSLAGEFQALLDAVAAADPPPLLLASIRDILVAPTKPDRVARTHALVARRYDAVLVHGDEEAVPLDRSWPVDEALRAKLTYTGYVGPDEVAPVPLPASGEDDWILVSGGASSASLPLYRAALGAAALSPARRWRILIGHAVDEADVRALARDAPTHVVVERARPDFRSLLARAAVFVGQAGYNTVMDIVATKARAVLVPYEEGHETEQRLRAEGLAEGGRASLLAESDLTPASLLAAVDEAGSRPRPSFEVSLDGQERSADVIETLARAHRARSAGEAAQ